MRNRLLCLVAAIALIAGCATRDSGDEQIQVVVDNWSLLEARYGGMPMLVRVNVGLKPIAGHKRYRHQVGITVAFQEPNANGLPSAQEGIELKSLEDSLVPILCAGNTSLLALVVTTAGAREFVLYTRDPAAARNGFSELERRAPGHTLSFAVRRDDKWFTYRQYAGEL